MGIYGALATAVTGMRAQAFALENISGNIANSQTTGYKRMETGFIDLIPDAAVGRQVPGAVLAYSRSTNDVRGDIITSPTGTHIALNGSGFFIVSQKTGTTDGQAVFGDANFYTRRGDFEMDREGYLMNGAGYYLRGVPIDAETGNVAGSVPEMIKIGNGLIPARSTTRVQYQLNLPAVPAVGLLYAPAQTGTNTGGIAGGDLLTAFTDFSAGETFTINTGQGVQTFTEGVDGTTVQELIDWINGNANINATASLAGGNIQIVANDVQTGLTIAGSGQLPGVTTQGVPEFLNQTVEGGAITVYTPNGASVNVQMRWGMLSENPNTWQLYYMSQSNPQQWVTVPGGEFGFNAAGALATLGGNPVAAGDVVQLNLPNLTVNGTTVGNVMLDFGIGGITQFSNANGRASVTQLSQNGYAAGSFMSVAINDAGRVVATYSNGEQIELYQIITANFNAQNMLKRMDGGVYAATAQSGEAILSIDGGISGGALESSNTDISDEFTKLIVTQQAYAAGTRIVSTSDKMLQEALNMIR
ncbi:flagellar hook protein FlgE [Pelagibacterium limicola]|uniref:flagellar hook protein FlgE n=1 Tax=Pelagibacterium limicola TaxID=2791022 RepID=UPI0018AF57E6|nr:flagellar hook-basal body complex protein [Pelagibacterium limicola]